MAVTGLAAVLLVIASLLIVISIAQPIARKLEVSEMVLLAIAGILIGFFADFVLQSSNVRIVQDVASILLNFPISSEAFLVIFLPALVFQGALMMDVRRLAHEIVTILLLAIVAVILSTAFIGFALYPFVNDMSFVVCLLIGAIVATTDPSAVAGIFRDIGAPARLTRLVEGEALFNDAAAIAIFSIIIPSVTSHITINIAQAFVDFLGSFALAVIVGIAGGYLALLLMSVLADSAAELTISLALPYLIYIVSDEIFDISGVVATTCAGLTFSAYGPSTVRPQTWQMLKQLWQQLVFWAGSLLFILASMVVPRLLQGMTLWDGVLIIFACVAALFARMIVVCVILPLLSSAHLSPPVPVPYRITMVWGGLRGAITLALALAVMEDGHVALPIAHFVGAISTGFVLVTLFLNGLTLRPLVLLLRLDRLSPIDEAMRHQVLSIGLENVYKSGEKLGKDLGFSKEALHEVLYQVERRSEEEQAVNVFDQALTDLQRVNLALVIIASQERSILLELFRIHGLSRRVMETMLRSAETAIDITRFEGRNGYIHSLRRRMEPTIRLRIAQWCHTWLHWDKPLVICMTERCEMLLVAHFVSISLRRFMNERLLLTMGARVTGIVKEIVQRQARLLDEALETFRLHYPNYAEMLEYRIFSQIILRLEADEYETLHSESLISDELSNELQKDLRSDKHYLDKMRPFDLRIGITQRMKNAHLFKFLPVKELEHLAKIASLGFVVPQEILIKRGAHVRFVYFISSGLMECYYHAKNRYFGVGALIGLYEAFYDVPCPATIRSARFGHYIAIDINSFKRLLGLYPQFADAVRESYEENHLLE